MACVQRRAVFLGDHDGEAFVATVQLDADRIFSQNGKFIFGLILPYLKFRAVLRNGKNGDRAFVEFFSDVIRFFGIIDRHGKGLDGDAVDLEIIFLFLRAVGKPDHHAVFSERQRDDGIESLYVFLDRSSLENGDGVGRKQKITHAQRFFANDRGGNAVSLQNVALGKCEIRGVDVRLFT